MSSDLGGMLLLIMGRDSLHLKAEAETFSGLSFHLPLLVSSVSQCAVPSLSAIDAVLVIVNKSMMPLLGTQDH